MFEYHGWIAVNRTPEAEDDDDADRAFDAPAITQIHSLLERFDGYVADLQYHNGLPMVWLQGFPNHCLGLDADLVALYRRIGEIARGSYGILFMHDDEAGSDRWTPGRRNAPVDAVAANTWRLYVLRRGELEEKADPFFSPHTPTVEDPWSAS